MLEKVEYDFTCDEGPAAEFKVHRFRLVERLNRPYTLELELVTETIDVDTKSFLGAGIELVITRGDHMRTLYGVVKRVGYVGTSADRLIVRVVAVPAFALLKQRVHTRIFQDLSVQDVVKKVLEPALEEHDRTFAPGDAPSRGTKPRDYCVQYHESDFAFVSRLLEEEGISYLFVHDESKGHEVLTLRYENAEYEDTLNVDGTRVFPLVSTNPGVIDRESVQTFAWALALVPTALRRLDYDLDTPKDPLVFEIQGSDARGRTRRRYDHMDRRFIEDDVEARANDRFEAEVFGGEGIEGTGNAIGFGVGLVFELERHIVAGLEQAYVIHRVVHEGSCPEVLLSPSPDDDFNDEGPRYTNAFACVPSSVPIRPRPRTRKPRVLGPQTGIVSGPSGEEIHTDALGRIVVQFHWEEEPQYDDTSSCWVRVAQTWAGPGWGTMFIPRIGMEVVVTFLEGNPDRPLVTGCVYNGVNGVPYTLPDEKTKSTIKSNSSPGGDGFNELRFEDAAGSEEVFIHAQKDFNEVTENDHTTTVHANETNTIDENQTNSIGGDQSTSVTGQQTISVEKNRTVTIDGSEAVTIKGAEANSGVSGGKLDITGDYKVDASNQIDVQAPTHIKLECGGSSILIEPGKITITAGGQAMIVLDADALMKSSAGTQVKLDADALAQASTGSSVKLTADVLAQSQGTSQLKLDADALLASSGQSSVKLDASATVTGTSSATVTAPTSTLAGGGGSVEAAAAGVTAAGGTVDISGGMVNVSGGMVKVN